MCESYEQEVPDEGILEHYQKELERTEEKYQLNKLFGKKGGNETNSSSFLKQNENNNASILNQEVRNLSSVTTTTNKRKQSNDQSVDPFGMDQKIKNLQDMALAISRQGR